MTRLNALFESWRGQYSDSPRPIAELLAEKCVNMRQTWTAEPGTSFPSGVLRVGRNTPAYFRHLFTANVVVANDIIPRHMIKGPRVKYLQTWHGTPLKLIGLDEHRYAYAGASAHMAKMRRDVAKWDFLLSAGSACTEIFRSAFGFEGEVWETGYPRNDVLKSPAAPQIRANVRASLGIDPDKRVVLYAPTWRDDAPKGQGGFQHPGALDPSQLGRILDPNTVVLSRMHRNVAVASGNGSERVLDVSAHPDIAELYLAADVLISDYSSATYDYAVTKKPIVLFAPDLERYRDEVRGFYFDFDDWAPGPIVRTLEDLAAVLAKPDELALQGQSPKYARFLDRFCPHEDGRATQRVVDRLLGVLND